MNTQYKRHANRIGKRIGATPRKARQIESDDDTSATSKGEGESEVEMEDSN